MMLDSTIREKLAGHLEIEHLDLRDETGAHLHHQNYDGGAHISAVIVSPSFADYSLLERHKLVYSALGAMLKKEIHAFSMKTYTPEEWKELSPKSAE